MVARHVRDVEAAGSSPAIPTLWARPSGRAFVCPVRNRWLRRCRQTDMPSVLSKRSRKVGAVVLVAVAVIVGLAVSGLGRQPIGKTILKTVAKTARKKPAKCDQSTISITSGAKPVPFQLQNISWCPNEYIGDNVATLSGLHGFTWGKPFVADNKQFDLRTGKHYSIAVSWCHNLSCNDAKPSAPQKSPAKTAIPEPGCFLLRVEMEQTNGGDGSNIAYALVVSDRSIDVSTCLPDDSTAKIDQP